MKKNLLGAAIAASAVIMFVAWYFTNMNAAPHEMSFSAASESPSFVAATEVPVMKAYITGEVNNPGVYDITGDMRVEDLLALAGGATAEADLLAVNLSQKLKDEQKVIVPKIGETISRSSGLSGDVSSSVVDINSATKEELMTLPGIGDVLSGEIIRYREKNGLFKNKDELMNVGGIGQKTYEKLMDMIVVN